MFNLTAVGRLTADPVLNTYGDNTVCKMSIATDRYIGSKDGKPQTETDYLDIEVWGAQAAVHAEQLGKGHMISAQGDLVQQRWQTDDGTKRSKHALKPERIEYLAKPNS